MRPAGPPGGDNPPGRAWRGRPGGFCPPRCPPLVVLGSRNSLLLYKNPRKVLFRSGNFYFCIKNNTMVVLLKTSSVRVSFIQIMQIRVQNERKSVRKSRYDGDISTPPSLNLCLSSSNSVDKLKVIKKNFYKLCLLLLLYVCQASIQVVSKDYN